MPPRGPSPASVSPSPWDAEPSLPSRAGTGRGDDPHWPWVGGVTAPLAPPADRCRFPGGADAAPGLSGGRPRDRQHHPQRAEHRGAAPDQRAGTGSAAAGGRGGSGLGEGSALWDDLQISRSPGDRDPPLGGEPPRHRNGQPGARPQPAGAGGDPAAAAQCPGPRDRHVGQRDHPGGRRQKERPPRDPHQERGERRARGEARASMGSGSARPHRATP